VAEALLKGEEAELVRKGLELAKAGDGQMLKFFLERILPKERSVRIELPSVNGNGGAADSLTAIINAACAGEIAPSEAAALANLIIARARIVLDAEIKLRLDGLEERQRAIQQCREELR
jgi:hypothetical protein